MIKFLKYILNSLGYTISRRNTEGDNYQVYLQSLRNKYHEFTMIPSGNYVDNLRLCDHVKNIKGAVVECGVWRGGMAAGIAEVLGNERKYYLFDSFEGLPEVKDIDGKEAKEWQSNKESPGYHDNCKAEMEYAINALKLADITNYELIKGWFSDTLPGMNMPGGIALLRLDGDWYDSTMDCLKYLYPQVNDGGLIIIDDYYTWDGCAKAVYDYLSVIKSPSRIHETSGGVCYIFKKV